MPKLRTGQIAYKVVTEDNKSVYPLFFKAFGRCNAIVKQADVDKHWKTLIKLVKNYKPGSIVKQPKNAGPILCFRTWDAAERWSHYFDDILENCKIITVIGYEQTENIRTYNFLPEDWLHYIKNGDLPIDPVGITSAIGFKRVRIPKET